MRFHVDTTARIKRQAKKLKRILSQFGYAVQRTICHNLVARMLGYSNYNELYSTAGSIPGSLGDVFVDDETRTTRRNQHIEVLTNIGVGLRHAIVAMDQIRSTDYGSPSLQDDDDSDAFSNENDDALAFEEEWSLRQSQPKLMRMRHEPNS